MFEEKKLNRMKNNIIKGLQKEIRYMVIELTKQIENMENKNSILKVRIT